MRELVLGPRRVHEVLLLDDHDSAQLAELEDVATERRIPVQRVSARRLAGEARTAAPQGVVARAVSLRPVDLDELVAAPTPAGGAPLLVAVDGVTDPGNLGAILRSVEVLGFGGAVLPRHRAVRITPAAAKAAAGAIEHLPLALVGGIPAALAALSDAGLWIVGLDAGASRTVDHLTVADQGIALVVGSEGRGLGRLTRRRCDDVVAIPQAGRTESLNVAAATAVAGHEIVRSRRLR